MRPRVVPTMLTCAAGTGWPLSASVTRPLMNPVVCAAPTVGTTPTIAIVMKDRTKRIIDAHLPWRRQRLSLVAKMTARHKARTV
jgi:hypothetical protein